jgi:CubicO group peptidase (beta-lactamase class C family)
MRCVPGVIGPLLLVALLAAPSAVRADGALLDETVGLSGLAMVLESGATGMVLAVVHGDQDNVVGFGETSKGNGREPDGQSLVRLGSISKAVAGELLGGLAAEGRLSLIDRLQDHAPAGTRVPDVDGRPITLLDLATHTAALPRELPLAPLSGAAPCVSTANIAVSGGVYSTADDMVLWLRHDLARANPAVRPTLALTHAAYVQRQDLEAAIGFDEAGPMDAIALAWLVEAADGHRPMILQKSGGLTGFMSYIAFAPSRGVGAFVSVNRVDFGMFDDLTDGVHELIAMLAPR